MPYYAKVLYNACKSYPDWAKGRQVHLPDVPTGESEAAAASFAENATSDDVDENLEIEEKQ